MKKIAILAGFIEEKVKDDDELYIEIRKLQEDLIQSDYMQVAISLGRIEAKVGDNVEFLKIVKEMETVLLSGGSIVKKASLAELNLTPRTHNLLMREGYTTVDDVIFANHKVLKEKLVNVKNGLKAYNELLRKLKELGFA